MWLEHFYGHDLQILTANSDESGEKDETDLGEQKPGKNACLSSALITKFLPGSVLRNLST
jgi:hypothetical protein